MPQHGNKAALFYLKVYPAEALKLVPGIGVMYIFKPYDRVQGKFPFMPPSGSLLRRGDTVRCR